MEDNLEKLTINIDSNNGQFINDYEFYVDILEDIKNCIYIKTLKTEIHIDKNYVRENSHYDYRQNPFFLKGDYVYIQLNDFNRIMVPSKEVIPMTESDRESDQTISYYNFEGTHIPGILPWPIYKGTVLYNQGGMNDDAANSRRHDGRDPYNFKIKNIYYNNLKYYDSIYIDESLDIRGSNSELAIYKKELNGTSCGPKDTNTLVLNPILPELKKFNIKLYGLDENGKHILLPIRENSISSKLVVNNLKWIFFGTNEPSSTSHWPHATTPVEITNVDLKQYLELATNPINEINISQTEWNDFQGIINLTENSYISIERNGITSYYYPEIIEKKITIGIFRVIMEFTIYYNRKKITRV